MTNSGTAPATHINMSKVSRIIINDIEKIARELHLVDGLFHLQYIVDNNGAPHIIEVMRRAPGNWSTSTGSISTGLNIDEWIIRSECGLSLSSLPVRLSCHHGYYGYHTILGPRNGILNNVFFSEEIKKNIYQYFVWEENGHEIVNYMYEKVGVVFLWFPTLEEMNSKIARINELIYVEYNN